jgi:uncharacterized ubiquitin-like protein YukD
VNTKKIKEYITKNFDLYISYEDDRRIEIALIDNAGNSSLMTIYIDRLSFQVTINNIDALMIEDQEITIEDVDIILRPLFNSIRNSKLIIENYKICSMHGFQILVNNNKLKHQYITIGDTLIIRFGRLVDKTIISFASRPI